MTVSADDVFATGESFETLSMMAPARILERALGETCHETWPKPPEALRPWAREILEHPSSRPVLLRGTVPRPRSSPLGAALSRRPTGLLSPPPQSATKGSSRLPPLRGHACSPRRGRRRRVVGLGAGVSGLRGATADAPVDQAGGLDLRLVTTPGARAHVPRRARKRAPVPGRARGLGCR